MVTGPFGASIIVAYYSALTKFIISSHFYTKNNVFSEHKNSTTCWANKLILGKIVVLDILIVIF